MIYSTVSPQNIPMIPRQALCFRYYSSFAWTTVVLHLPIGPSANIGPRLSILEMGKVESDTPMATRIRNGHNSAASEAIAAIFWYPKQGTFWTAHPPFCIQEVNGNRKA